jgi:hypothetical protein
MNALYWQYKMSVYTIMNGSLSTENGMNALYWQYKMSVYTIMNGSLSTENGMNALYWNVLCQQRMV